MSKRDSVTTLVKIIHNYDGQNSLVNFLSEPWAVYNDSYQKLLSHANELGLEVGMIPEGSKLMLNITIKI